MEDPAGDRELQAQVADIPEPDLRSGAEHERQLVGARGDVPDAAVEAARAIGATAAAASLPS